MDTNTTEATIAQKMQDAGLNLPALALATRIPYSTLQRKLRGGRAGSITIAELGAIADALHVSPADLVRGESQAVAA